MRLLHWLLVTGMLGLATARAEAGYMAEEFSASFGPTSTLGGVAFGTDTAFTFHATFDPTAPLRSRRRRDVRGHAFHDRHCRPRNVHGRP